MGTLNRRAIHCPISKDHPKRKILLVFGDEEIIVYCKEHKWLKIELTKDQKKMNFKGISAQITEIPFPTHFNFEPIPAIAIGDFDNHRNHKCQA